MERKLNILLLGTQMALGGAQKILLDQASWFRAHGHFVTVSFLYDRDGLHDFWKQTYDFPILNLEAFESNAGLLRKLKLLFSGILRMWKIFYWSRFDVIETFTHDCNILGLPLAKLAGVPVRIATHHGLTQETPPWRQRMHTCLINIGVADTLVAVSENTRRKAELEGIRPDRLSVISNGISLLDTSSVNTVEIRKELGLDVRDLFLISVGRLVYEKGHEYLVRAIPAVKRKFPNVKVAICGEGPLRSWLEVLIANLDLHDEVLLLGSREDVSSLLASADIFVLPSRSEGMPIALLEAMMTGLPVIATRLDGVEEVVQDGLEGMLVPLGDPTALADAISELLADSSLRTKMGSEARARVLDSFTTDIMCEKYLHMIQTLMWSRHRSETE